MATSSTSSRLPNSTLRAVLDFLYRPSKGRRFAFAGSVGVYLVIRYFQNKRRAEIEKKKRAQSLASGTTSPSSSSNGTLKSSSKVAVNKEFFERLRYILNVCVPDWNDKTVLILALHSAFLILRTYLSVVVAKLDGRLVKNLVAANGREFLKGIVFWFLIAVPATYTNSMIRFFQSKLAIALRTSLTNYVHKLYLSNRTYYKAVNLDNRIEGADQLITTDINRFCNALASLYSNLGKPVLDIIIFNYQLASNIGIGGMTGLLLNYFVTATIMRMATPSFGKLAAEEAKLEGDFRTAHARLLTNSEEIAFYNGANRELGILDLTYRRLIKHINGIYKIRVAYNMFEDFIIKYCWSAVGLMLSSVPVFFPEYAGSRVRQQELEVSKLAEQESQEIHDRGGDAKTGSRTQGFITNKRLMISLADAGGRIMYSYKELSELAGYTSRVYTMLRVLQDLSDDKYNKMGNENAEFSLEDIQGTIIDGVDGIRFEKVPIASPTGDVLVRDLSVTVGPGEHLMITGPNGSGKTSIVRVLAGLWPLFRGTLSRPSQSLSSIFYIPQRPYLSLGTLREQIIYPHTIEDMHAAGRSDEELFKILELVYLAYIPGREGGLEVVKEWKDVFSGGEKQRMQLARLFYHRPRYAVMDECTSAVSVDVEGLLYNTAKDMGITIITISHRPALFKYHRFLLRVGEGTEADEWSLERIGDVDQLATSVESEIKRIEGVLSDVEGWRKRLAEINKELQLEVQVGGGGRTDGEKVLKHAKRTLV